MSLPIRAAVAKSSRHAALLLALVVAGALFAVVARRANAQGQAHAASAPATPPRAPSPGAHTGGEHAALHMELTPAIKGDRADSARAASIAATLRVALIPFRDTAAAVAAGYRMFAPKLKNQKVYHFTSSWRAVQEGFRFEPAKPTSLLYTKGADGTFTLVGAMYTAPKRLGYDRLDARVPLSVARWHKHVNWCMPKRGAAQRWLERRSGEAVFGPESPIATREACDAVDGVFRETVFGWMLHARVFAGDDPASVWGDEHAGHDMHEGMKLDASMTPP
jgi:hypothetical protein